MHARYMNVNEIAVTVYELHMHAQFSSSSSSFETYFSPFSFGINNSTVVRILTEFYVMF